MKRYQSILKCKLSKKLNSTTKKKVKKFRLKLFQYHMRKQNPSAFCDL